MKMYSPPSKKVEIHLTEWQKQRSNRIFELSLAMWNRYVAYTREALNSDDGFIDPYTFNREYYTLMMKPNEPYWKELPSGVRTDILGKCWHAIKKHWHGKHADHVFPFKSKKKMPVKSYFIAKPVIRFGRSNKWVHVAYIGYVRLKEVGYITDTDMQYVSSGRIYYDKATDKWFLILNLQYLPKDVYIKDHPISETPSEPVAIDLGVKSLITLSTPSRTMEGSCTFNGYSNPSTDPFSLRLMDKIFRIDGIIASKVHWNRHRFADRIRDNDGRVPDDLFDTIYHSRKIDKLRQRQMKLYQQLRDHRMDVVKKFISALVRSKPEYIVIEGFDTTTLMSRKGSSELHRNISNSLFAYIRLYLEWKCSIYDIPVIHAPALYASSQLCSSCGERNFIYDKHKRVYKCKECGLVIDRDVNAARNLLKYGFNVRKNSIMTEVDSIGAMIM